MPITFTDKLLEDISENIIKPEVLDLRGMQIDDMGAIRLANALKKNIHIVVLYIAENEIGDKGIIELASISHLEELDINTNKFGTGSLEALSKSKLQVLNLSNNKLGGEFACLGRNCSLKELDASACQLSGDDIESFVKEMKSDNKLEIFYLSNNQIDDRGARALARTKITKRLNLDSNEITDKSVFNNYSAQHLYLDNNPCMKDEDLVRENLDEGPDFESGEWQCLNLGDFKQNNNTIPTKTFSAYEFFKTDESKNDFSKDRFFKKSEQKSKIASPKKETLETKAITDQNKSSILTEESYGQSVFTDKLLKDISNNAFNDEVLDLRSNHIDNMKAIELAKALKKNSHIKVVFLSENAIGDAGIIELSSVPTLEELYVGCNTFSAEGVKALAKSKLLVVDISGHEVGEDIIHFSTNKTLKELIAQNCEIGDEIAILGKGENLLEELNLSHNKIGDVGAKALLQIKTLKRLCLPYNKVEDKSLLQNCSIRQFYLHNNPCARDDNLIRRKEKSQELEIVIEESKSYTP